MKKFIVLSVIFSALWLASAISAQGNSTPIEYGQTVTGEITTENFEVPYVFSGKQGDVIVIEMAAVDALDGLSYPAAALFDANSSMLGTVESYGSAVLAAKLPADGDYTILATREDGRTGDSVGAYMLTVLKPPVLIPSEATEGSVTNLTQNYYVVEASDSFSVIYERVAGDFHPEISIQRIGDMGELEEVGVLGGEFLSQGKVGLDAPAGPYCIVVRESLRDFNFEDVSADYLITLAP